MSKESNARERNTCPKCWTDYTFLEYHLSHCKGTGVRPPKPDKRKLKDVPLAEVKEAIKKIVKPGAVSAAVDAKTTQGSVRDEKLRTKRGGRKVK